MKKYPALATVSVLAVTWFLCRGIAATDEPVAKISSLYEAFDPDKLKEKHLGDAGKGVLDEGGSRAGLTITPPGHLVKDAHWSGEISEEQVKAIQTSLLSEMIKLAEDSKVRIIDKPKDTILDLPISYLRTSWFGWVAIGSLRGSYFTYRQGNIEGTVQVIAANTDRTNPKRWTISCAMHEAAP
jgi:hypothetical protein